MKKLLPLILLFLPFVLNAQTTITSPEKTTSVKISADNNGVSYSVSYDNLLIMKDCKAAISSKSIIQKYTLKQSKPVQKTEKITSPFYRFSEFEVKYTEQKFTLNKDLGLVFRVFDDGVAYRFVYTGKNTVEIENEVAEFSFTDDYESWLSFSTNDKDPFAMAFQNIYSKKKLSEQDKKLSFLPVVADCKKVKATVLESDLEHFPGMFLKADGKTLKAEFAKYPKKFDKYPWRGMTYVTERENFIAKINPNDNLPWRIISLTENDTEMPVSNLVYALNSPNRIGNTDWIIPGKSAWDWWNDWNIKGVDFQAGINTETYKYFIDFAASHSLEYVILDEGWYDSKKADIMNPIADINLKELISYANERGVGVVLWAVFNVIDENLNNGQLTIDNEHDVFSHYAKMGVKGFKIDFLDRNDQTAVEMAYRIAKKAAENHLVLDYHGFYPPTGINRAYPNIINFESVFGMEEMKWNEDKKDMPLYDVTFPFIRMMCGPVDYTPGAMRNGTKHWYSPIYGNPMSMGTRCHQLAAYVVHDSPFTMLADAPSAYLQEESFTDFLSKIPNNPDFTKILSGKIGEYIVSARRFGQDWYIGGLTNWDGRDLTVDFSFLDDNAAYKATLYKDGKNAYHNGEDYAVENFSVKKSDVKTIHLASGGGFVIKLKKSW
ncbi:MAG: glycoside hydrolase family 97 protein [Bacteroidales bacterium]|nr:glycoside hydrolase family 97 protein [Bacteroidales bacterium]